MFIIAYTHSRTKDILEEVVDITSTTGNIYTITTNNIIGRGIVVAKYIYLRSL